MTCAIINVSNFHLRKGYRPESRGYVINCSTFKFQTIVDISEEKTMVLKRERMNQNKLGSCKKAGFVLTNRSIFDFTS